MLTALLVLAVGCSKTDNADIEGLLQTVPADANAVAVVNVDRLAKSLGCKTDGKTITLSSEAELAIDKGAINEEGRRIIRDICQGNSGVALSNIVYFSAARDYVTGLLDDPDKFISFVQKYEGNDSIAIEVRSEGDARMVGHAVVIGNQFWISATGTPDEEQLQHYKTLKGPQSFAANDVASRLVSDTDVVTFVADINKAIADIPNKKEVRMGLAFALEDPSYVAGGLAVEKKNVSMKAAVLNSDLKPAKLLIPTGKIDTKMVKDFDGAAEAFLAVYLPKELMKKVADLAGMSGGVNGGLAQAIGQLEGTVAARVGKNTDDIEARVRTTGQDFIQLTQLLQMLGINVTRDGDLLTLSTGEKNFEGSITSVDAASALKGAWIGVIAADTPARDTKTTLLLKEEKKSLVLDMKVEGGLDALINMALK